MIRDAILSLQFLRRPTPLLLLVNLAVVIACAQTTRAPDSKESPDAPRGPALKRYEISPASLPAPFASPSAVNPPKMVTKPDQVDLKVPPGFQVSVFAETDLKRPRWLARAPNGDVFVAESQRGQISVLRDTNGDGKADQQFVFAAGLAQPFGMAFWREYLYVGNTNAVVRFKYEPGRTQATAEPEKIADLPGLGYRQHWTRNVVFSPDGAKLYVTVGSESNVDAEKDPMRAAISEFNPDGTGHRIYASGTRNPIGVAFQPGTRTLWAAVQERDGLGDDLVPDFVTSIKEGGFYGWPYSYIGSIEEPGRKGERPDLVKAAIVPDVLVQAHSAVIGLVFYEGTMFPDEYRGDAFVSFHGSWNRSKRTGYKIVRIPFRGGKAEGAYEDFVSGWMIDEDSPDVWGRPAGLLVLKDGSLLIADDGADKIWRVTYSRPR